MSSKVLFVEGDTDRCFFERLIKIDDELSQLEINVEPKGRVSKVISSLKDSRLLTKLNDGEITHLGVIADADYADIDTGGFQQRWDSLTSLLVALDYDVTLKPEQANQGSIFTNQNGLNPTGLWLMPNHFDEGALEDLVLATRITTNKQAAIFSHVESSIKQLADNKLFAEHHESKAKAFNWLAWQKRPAHFIGEVINPRQPAKSLINIESPEIQGLINWLKKVFGES